MLLTGSSVTASRAYKQLRAQNASFQIFFQHSTNAMAIA